MDNVFPATFRAVVNFIPATEYRPWGPPLRPWSKMASRFVKVVPAVPRHGQEPGKDMEDVRPLTPRPGMETFNSFRNPSSCSSEGAGTSLPPKGNVPGAGQHPSLPGKDEIGLSVRNVRLDRQRMITGRFPVEKDIPGNGSPE